MTIKGHILRTASEIAIGRYMRAPDHPTGEQPGAAPAAEAPAAEAPKPEDVDEFAATFENLTQEEAKPVDDKGGKSDADRDEPAPAGGGGAGDASGAADAGDGKSGVTAGKDDKGAKGKKGEAPEDKSAAPAEGKDDKTGKGDKEPAPKAEEPADTDDILKRLAKAVKETPTEEKKEAPAAEEKPLFTTDEEAKIEAFKKEWPDVAEAMDLQARAVAHSVLKYAFSSIAEQFIPLRDAVEALATRAHYGDLKGAVGEYTDEEREKIIGWVKEHPAYLQSAMLSVIEEGTAEEVADLVNRYREATGSKPAGAQDDKVEAPGGDTELSGEAKQAAAALAPVSSKRSAVQAPDDLSDYDGAFAKFADSL